MGTRHQPQRARSWELALHIVGGARGRPGGCLVPGCGASGVGRSPTPDCPSFGACGWGPLVTGCGCGVCGHGDLSPNAQRALLRACFARCGGSTRAPGRGRLLPERAASGVRRSRRPDRSSLAARGRGPLPTGCGCGGWGRGEPSPTPPRALLRAGFARCGDNPRAPGGGASCLGVGRLGSGALPAPTARPLGRAAGAHYPMTVGAGGVGVGTCHQPHSARSCELASRAVGTARGRRGGGPLAWTWGVRGRALSQTPTARPFGRAPGARYPLAVGAGGVGVGTCHHPHHTHSCELALRAVGAAGGRMGGAPLAWVWGVLGRALSHPRPPVLLGVRPGPSSH